MRRQELFLFVAVVAIALLCAAAAAADTLKLPANTGEIEEEAFAWDTSLDEVVLPEGITKIGARAFADSSIKRIYLPDSLEYIADDAFVHCADVKWWGPRDQYAEGYCDEHNIPFSMPATPVREFTFEFTSDTEATLTGWTGWKGDVIVPEMADETHRITAIGDRAFYQNGRLTSIYLPDSIVSIGDEAFYYCSRLISVHFPRDLEIIGGSAFAHCGMQEITLNQNLKIICGGAFSSSKLVTVNIPASVTEFRVSNSGPGHRGVFMGCEALTSFHCEASLESVGYDPDVYLWHFNVCKNLTSVTFAEGVRRIPDGMFHWADALTDVSLPSTLEEIGTNAFEFCKSLTEISIPDSVRVIGREAFRSCEKLETIHLPGSLQELEYDTFLFCKSLREIDLPYGMKRISSHAFGWDDTPIHRIYMPETLVEISYSNNKVTSVAKGRFTLLYSVNEPEIWTEYGADAVLYAQNNYHSYYYLSLTDENLSDARIWQGVPFNLKGMVRSTVELLSVSARVLDASGQEVRNVSVAPGKAEYSLAGNFHSQLDLESLPIGTYTVILEASTAKSSEELIRQRITVGKAPLVPQLTGYNFPSSFLSFAEEGLVMQFRGTIDSNYPMTNVTVRVSKDGQVKAERSVTPNAKTYNLANLGLSVTYDEPGTYTIQVIVQGNGETVTAASNELLISEDPSAHVGTIDQNKLQEFIGDGRNKMYFFTNWSSMDEMKADMLDAGIDGFPGFANLMGQILVYGEDFINALSRDILSGFVTGEMNDSFFVEIAEEEIKSLIRGMSIEDFERIDYDHQFIGEVIEAFEQGRELGKNFEPVTNTIAEWESNLIDIYNEVTGSDPEVYSVLSECPGLSTIIGNCMADHVIGMKVLDMIENNCAYSGEFAGYYQTAVAILRQNYENSTRNAFYELFRLSYKKLVETGTEMLVESLMGAPAVAAFKVVSALNQFEDATGAYEDAKAFTEYLLRMESYHSAEKSFEEAFETVYNGDTSDTAVNRMTNCFNLTRYCGIRALEKLLEIKESDPKYMQNISFERVHELYLDFDNEAVCPYIRQ